MSIPDFQALMLPVLRASAAGDITSREIRNRISGELELTADELAERQASGTQTVFTNRTAWAIFHLERAGLLERVKRGVYCASGAGNEVLKGSPQKIDLKLLKTFPQWVIWRSQNKVAEDDAESSLSTETPAVTPEEQIEKSHQLLDAALAQQLLERVREISSKAFEELVVNLLLRLGYGGGRRETARLTGRPGDGGIDGTIDEDALGLDAVYIQAKRYAEGNTVGRPAVQQFAGSLDGVHASKGILITTSNFSPDAHEFVRHIGKRITLIDGRRLARLMIEKDVGVSATKTYVIKQIDENYFVEN